MESIKTGRKNYYYTITENHTNGQSTHVIISNERLEENEYRQLRSIEDEYKLV